MRACAGGMAVGRSARCTGPGRASRCGLGDARRALKAPRLPPAPIEPLRGERRSAVWERSASGRLHRSSCGPVPGAVVRRAHAAARWARPGSPSRWPGRARPRGAARHAGRPQAPDRLRAAHARRLGLARELLEQALAEHAAQHELSVEPERVPGVDVAWSSTWRAIWSTPPATPARSCRPIWSCRSAFRELAEESLPVLELGEGLRLRGRIDRVDIGPEGEAVVYDYKGERAPRARNWASELSFQIALYMRAVEQLLHLEGARRLLPAAAGARSARSGSDASRSVGSSVGRLAERGVGLLGAVRRRARRLLEARRGELRPGRRRAPTRAAARRLPLGARRSDRRSARSRQPRLRVRRRSAESASADRGAGAGPRPPARLRVAERGGG